MIFKLGHIECCDSRSPLTNFRVNKQLGKEEKILNHDNENKIA